MRPTPLLDFIFHGCMLTKQAAQISQLAAARQGYGHAPTTKPAAPNPMAKAPGQGPPLKPENFTGGPMAEDHVTGEMANMRRSLPSGISPWLPYNASGPSGRPPLNLADRMYENWDMASPKSIPAYSAAMRALQSPMGSRAQVQNAYDMMKHFNTAYPGGVEPATMSRLAVGLR